MKITLFFFLSTVIHCSMLFSSEIVENTENSKNIQQQHFNFLEYERDNAFVETDIPCIQKLTYQICDMLINTDTASQIDLSDRIHSILKTRHLFPGKVDLLGDFYQVDPLYYDINLTYSHTLNLPKKNLALVIVTDAIAKCSIFDEYFYAYYKNNTLLKNKISEELHRSVLNKETIEITRFEVSLLLTDNNIIRLICELERQFSPSINFKQFYDELVTSPTYRDYELAGTSSCVYWPTQLLPLNERSKIQRILTRDKYRGRFLSSSIVAMNIDDNAVKDFPMLEGHTGCFMPYNFSLITEFDPIDFLLISEAESLFYYNKEKLLKTQQRYLRSINSRLPCTTEDFLYFAEQGISEAQYLYGTILLNEAITKQDFSNHKIYYEYIRHAAQQGYIKAQYSMGQIYHSGVDIKPDFKTAAYWYHLAADQGCKKAQYNLGIMCQRGTGVSKNMKESVKFFQLAAHQGHAESQYNLGTICRAGIYLPKNEMQSAQFYRLAADQGHLEAQYKLSVMYRRGVGVSKDLVEAERLYNMSQGRCCTKENVTLQVP